AFVSCGVPSAASLAQELTSLVPALVRANAPPPTQDGGLLDRLQAGASRLVKVRPVDEAPGDDPAAVIARIEGKAKRADIAGALDDLARMPANLRAPAEAWIKKAQARAAALDAAQKSAADALAALSKPAQYMGSKDLEVALPRALRAPSPACRKGGYARLRRAMGGLGRGFARQGRAQPAPSLTLPRKRGRELRGRD